jgi:hypothetical protein
MSRDIGRPPERRSLRLCFPLLFLAFVTATLTAAPAITGLYNAVGWIPSGLPNSGAGFSLVGIPGISGVPVALPVSSYIEFICTADASAGSFTIPSAILNLLPPNGFGTTTKAGVDIQISGIPLERFTVAGSRGLAVATLQ